MKKALIVLSVLASLGIGAQAQSAKSFYQSPYAKRNSGSLDKGDFILSFGYGFPNLKINSYANRTSFGPLYLKGEYAIIDEVSVGAHIATAFGNHKYGPGNRYSNKSTVFSTGAMGYYHFNKLIPVSQLDVFVGAGFNMVWTHYTEDPDFRPVNNSYTDFDAYGAAAVGARWYFTNTFGVYTEFKYDGLSNVNLGVSFRF
jgi:hypothetical protein